MTLTRLSSVISEARGAYRAEAEAARAAAEAKAAAEREDREKREAEEARLKSPKEAEEATEARSPASVEIHSGTARIAIRGQTDFRSVKTFERSLAAIQRDIDAGYVSRARAMIDYDVTIDEQGRVAYSPEGNATSEASRARGSGLLGFARFSRSDRLRSVL